MNLKTLHKTMLTALLLVTTVISGWGASNLHVECCFRRLEHRHKLNFLMELPLLVIMLYSMSTANVTNIPNKVTIGSLSVTNNATVTFSGATTSAYTGAIARRNCCYRNRNSIYHRTCCGRYDLYWYRKQLFQYCNDYK